MNCRTIFMLMLLFFGFGISGQVIAQELQATKETLSSAYKGKSYSPYAGRSFPSRPLWGDSHLHTGLSLDAGLFGARLGPEDAHRFARGEEVISSTGIPVKLSRPLDWLVVADHSDAMGFAVDIIAGKPHLLAEEKGRQWYDMMQSGEGVAATMEIIDLFSKGQFPEGINRHYLPDAALVGYLPFIN